MQTLDCETDENIGTEGAAVSATQSSVSDDRDSKLDAVSAAVLEALIWRFNHEPHTQHWD